MCEEQNVIIRAAVDAGDDAHILRFVFTPSPLVNKTKRFDTKMFTSIILSPGVGDANSPPSRPPKCATEQI